ncbi:MAG TPA: phosphotransferase [Marmoricola sp.]
MPEERVIDRLATFKSLPEWLAAPMRPERVAQSLVQHVPELADGRVRLLDCAADRLRAKGTEWLVRYSIRVADASMGAVRDVVLVGNLWSPLAEAAPATADGRPFGRPGWACWLPDLRLALRAQAMDEALPALPRLTEPAAVAELLEPLVRATGHPDASITACEPVVVRYKPGSRCTVVVQVSYAPGRSTPPSPIVVKTHQGDKGEVAWAAMNALWERPGTWRRVVQLAEPIAYVPKDRILVQGPVPGASTLKVLVREAVASGDPTRLSLLRDRLVQTARGLAAIHRSGASYGLPATFEDELAEVQEVVDRLSFSVPALADAAEPMLQWLAERSGTVPPDPIVAAHHDFRPAQVLLHEDGVGFIDFDGACMAEPALDVGRFRANLRDIGISTVDVTRGGPRVEATLSLLDDLCEHFLQAYLAYAEVSPTRVLLWECRDLFMTVLHAWTKVRLARVEPRLVNLVHGLRTSGLLER